MSNTPSNDRLLSIPQVAEYFQVSPNTIRNFIERGTLNPIKIGNQWRFKFSDLQEYLESQRLYKGDPSEGESSENSSEAPPAKHAILRGLRSV